MIEYPLDGLVFNIIERHEALFSVDCWFYHLSCGQNDVLGWHSSFDVFKSSLKVSYPDHAVFYFFDFLYFDIIQDVFAVFKLEPVLSDESGLIEQMHVREPGSIALVDGFDHINSCVLGLIKLGL